MAIRRHPEITVDINSRNIDKVMLHEGESEGTVLPFAFMDQGKPLDISGMKVSFCLVKPDGKMVVNSCTVTDARAGKVEYTVTAQTVSRYGRGLINLQLVKGSALAYSGTVLAEIEYTGMGGDSDGETSLFVETLKTSEKYSLTALQAQNRAEEVLRQVQSQSKTALSQAQSKAEAALKTAQSQAEATLRTAQTQSETTLNKAQEQADSLLKQAKDCQTKACNCASSAKMAEQGAKTAEQEAMDAAAASSSKAAAASQSAAEAKASADSAQDALTKVRDIGFAKDIEIITRIIGEKYLGPGPATLQSGDEEFGYFGEVNSREFGSIDEGPFAGAYATWRSVFGNFDLPNMGHPRVGDIRAYKYIFKGEILYWLPINSAAGRNGSLSVFGKAGFLSGTSKIKIGGRLYRVTTLNGTGKDSYDNLAIDDNSEVSKILIQPGLTNAAGDRLPESVWRLDGTTYLLQESRSSGSGKPQFLGLKYNKQAKKIEPVDISFEDQNVYFYPVLRLVNPL